ncbi:MAG TPA: phosphohydrolase [Candidatus Limnocylindria bacterium]|nr:phosphohydrolase [Candidatus Limnocylindria bacterium]
MTEERMTRPAVPGSRAVTSPLYQPDWKYVKGVAMDSFDRADWELLDAQRAVFYADNQADAVLKMFDTMREEATFGYKVNNYQHCLQSATRMYLDGHDEEDIVVGLLHDIGFVVVPSRHGAFAAELLGPYVSDRNRWMLERHQVFGDHHVKDHPKLLDPEARLRWRGHEFFDWGAEFAEKYDQGAVDPKFESAPADFFVPMVRRIFARKPRSIPIE